MNRKKEACLSFHNDSVHLEFEPLHYPPTGQSYVPTKCPAVTCQPLAVPISLPPYSACQLVAYSRGRSTPDKSLCLSLSVTQPQIIPLPVDWNVAAGYI